MNQIHGKTFSLQQITVKVPGQHMPVAKPSSLQTPVNTDNITGLGSQSLPDYNESSLVSSLDSSLVRANPSANGTDTEDFISRHSSFSGHIRNSSRDGYSPVSEEGDSDRDSARDGLIKSDRHLQSDRTTKLSTSPGHQRNSSMDDSILKQLRTRGTHYVPPDMTAERERSMTLLRAQILKRGGSKQSKLSPIFNSEEELCDPLRLESSHESLTKKGKKDRNNVMTGSEDSLKRTPGKHRRQRSIGGKIELGDGE